MEVAAEAAGVAAPPQEVAAVVPEAASEAASLEANPKPHTLNFKP